MGSPFYPCRDITDALGKLRRKALALVGTDSMEETFSFLGLFTADSLLLTSKPPKPALSLAVTSCCGSRAGLFVK